MSRQTDRLLDLSTYRLALQHAGLGQHKGGPARNGLALLYFARDVGFCRINSEFLGISWRG